MGLLHRRDGRLCSTSLWVVPVFLLLIVFLSACLPIEPPPTPTKTPQALPTLAPTLDPGLLTPTPAATPTPALPPDLSGVILATSDLPAGYLPASTEALAQVNASFSQAPFFDVVASSAYTITKPDGFEMLVSFAGIFTENNPLRADAPAMQNPRFALILFITGAEAEALNSEGMISGLDGIGETARGYYGLATRRGQPVRVDLVVFHRGLAGVYLFHLYPDRGVEGGAVVPLSRLLDVRLQAAP